MPGKALPSSFSIPLYRFHLKLELGSQTWNFKGNGCTQTIGAVNDSCSALSPRVIKKGEKARITGFKAIRRVSENAGAA